MFALKIRNIWTPDKIAVIYNPKIRKMCFYHGVMCSEDAVGMANFVGPEQSVVCPGLDLQTSRITRKYMCSQLGFCISNLLIKLRAAQNQVSTHFN